VPCAGSPHRGVGQQFGSDPFELVDACLIVDTNVRQQVRVISASGQVLAHLRLDPGAPGRPILDSSHT
jgi:hypothetical protein